MNHNTVMHADVIRMRTRDDSFIIYVFKRTRAGPM